MMMMMTMIVIIAITMKPQEGGKEYACQTTTRSQYSNFQLWYTNFYFPSILFPIIFSLLLLLLFILLLFLPIPLLNTSGTTCRTWRAPPMLPSGLTSKTFQRWKIIFNHVIVISSVAGFRQRLQHHDQCILQCEMERSEVVSQQRLQQGGSPARGNTNTRRIFFFKLKTSWGSLFLMCVWHR